MTKSRRALLLFAAASCPSPVLASAGEPTPEEIVGAYNRQVHEIMGSAAGARRCAPDDGGDAIVVCGRIYNERYRVPYDPPPGRRRRLIAGEPPSARDAMNAGGCLRLCEQPVTIDIVGAVQALGRGLDRLLHPD